MSCLHTVERSYDVELLLLSITACLVVGLPFPVNSSPLREQSVVVEISSGYRKHTVQMAGPDSSPHHFIERYDLLKEKAGAVFK